MLFSSDIDYAVEHAIKSYGEGSMTLEAANQFLIECGIHLDCISSYVKVHDGKHYYDVLMAIRDARLALSPSPKRGGYDKIDLELFGQCPSAFWNDPRRWDEVNPNKDYFWMVDRGAMKGVGNLRHLLPSESCTGAIAQYDYTTQPINIT
jgi:hypothetical protein